MPNVGKKKFPYDDAGMKAAREEMKKTGKDMVINFDEGGKVDDYQDMVKMKHGGEVHGMMGGGMPKYGHGGMGKAYGKPKKKK